MTTIDPETGAPWGAPGVFGAYRMSSTLDLESDLAGIAPFIAHFESKVRSRRGAPTRHRLIELVEAVEDDLRAHRAGEQGRHLEAVVELGHVVELLLEWKDDPAGSEIVRDLRDPNVYAHDILVLAAARILRKSWGNDLRIMKRNPATVADLRVTSAAGDVAIELKAPRELDGREWVRTKTPAQVAVGVLSRSRKQRHTAPASLLLVAGYRVPEFAGAALASHLDAQLTKRPLITAACVLSFGAHASDQGVAALFVHGRGQRPFSRAETQSLLSLQVTMRVMRNDQYRGPVPIVGLDESESGLRLPMQSLIALRQMPFRA